MKNQEQLKNKFSRNVKLLNLKPKLGLGKAVSTIRITNGLTCEIKEGNWELKTDMAEQVGGSASAPSPGVLGRAEYTEFIQSFKTDNGYEIPGEFAIGTAFKE